jgi:hypothetical protein
MTIKLTDDGTSVWTSCDECKRFPNGTLAEVCEACWGTFCQHGIKIMEVIPETRGKGFAREGQIVNPWPCPECSQEKFEAELQEEAAAYGESQRPDW